MRLIIITILTLFTTQVHATEIQYGVYTKHLHHYNPCGGDKYCKPVPLNETNHITTLFSNYGLGVGTMINSYERRSFMLMYRHGYTLPLFAKHGVHSKVWLTGGFVNGYSDVEPLESDVIPLLVGAMSFYKRHTVLTIGLSAPTVLVVSVGYKF